MRSLELGVVRVLMAVSYVRDTLMVGCGERGVVCNVWREEYQKNGGLFAWLNIDLVNEGMDARQ